MKIKAVFFDLDGTLLPMDQDDFIKAYLGELVDLLAPRGYEPQAVANALWSSTRDMMKNDGRLTNEQVFWNSFCSALGEKILEERRLIDGFYAEGFQRVKRVCGYTPLSRQIIDRLREASIPVVLATSPLFPEIATYSRIRWAGLEPSDFDYITTYENSSFCKPNPDYYSDLLGKLGLSPSECLMVGNDVADDMVAGDVGIRLFLLTDCLVNRKNADISAYRTGGFAELIDYIEEIIYEK